MDVNVDTRMRTIPRTFGVRFNCHLTLDTVAEKEKEKWFLVTISLPRHHFGKKDILIIIASHSRTFQGLARFVVVVVILSFSYVMHRSGLVIFSSSSFLPHHIITNPTSASSAFISNGSLSILLGISF